MTEQHAERRLVKHRLVGSCGLVARSRSRFSPAVSFELGGKGDFIAAVRRLPQLDLFVQFVKQIADLSRARYSAHFDTKLSSISLLAEKFNKIDVINLLTFLYLEVLGLTSHIYNIGNRNIS
ncbi:hypothetical protein T01_16120 [Trichinella spiralis]|uniref:Uncharacterized protein n=1 Tax=Trichinella spiralis TaxID=6334 RepID=A0A0V1AUZ0_TRISP|nr:hypothetical protein T01_16120 [Trichinella spiralis]